MGVLMKFTLRKTAQMGYKYIMPVLVPMQLHESNQISEFLKRRRRKNKQTNNQTNKHEQNKAKQNEQKHTNNERITKQNKANKAK